MAAVQRVCDPRTSSGAATTSGQSWPSDLTSRRGEDPSFAVMMASAPLRIADGTTCRSSSSSDHAIAEHGHAPDTQGGLMVTFDDFAAVTAAKLPGCSPRSWASASCCSARLLQPAHPGSDELSPWRPDQRASPAVKSRPAARHDLIALPGRRADQVIAAEAAGSPPFLPSEQYRTSPAGGTPCKFPATRWLMAGDWAAESRTMRSRTERNGRSCQPLHAGATSAASS